MELAFTPELIDFFKFRLTLLDFLIIGMGSLLFVYQLLKRIFTFGRSFYRKAEANPLFITREKLKLQYISSLIEMLPMIGIMGTVWGIMNALHIISDQDMPTVKDIATHIAPALSTTFFGLFFAVFNLFVYNFLHTYYSELIAWCQANGVTLPQSQENTLGSENEET